MACPHKKGLKMEFRDLSAEQRNKAQACATTEELLELAKIEGVELSDEELASVSGGWGDDADIDINKKVPCPQCGSTYVDGRNLYTGTAHDITFTCLHCGHEWAYTG